MNATITTNTNGNMSEIIISKKMGYKIVQCPTTDLEKKVQAITANLTSMGYTVTKK